MSSNVNEKFDSQSKTSSINLIVDDVETSITANTFSFSLFDSIYELFPKGKILINDFSGSMNEYLAFVNGTKIELQYGLTEESLSKCKYRVINNSTPEQSTNMSVGGDIELSLIHDYFNIQSRISKAYNNNISSIIKQLGNKYNFASYNIDETLNQGMWYQPYEYDSTFITKYLLPFAYSTNSNKTPFYCFITSSNVFNFKNWNNMINNSPKKRYYLQTNGDVENMDTTIYEIKYAQVEVSKCREFYNRLRYYFDSNGEYQKEPINALLSDFPSNTDNPIPIKVNTNNLTSLEQMYDDDIYAKETENNRKGLEINALRDVIGIDKVIIKVTFDNTINCGDVIQLNIPSVSLSKDISESSLRTSGNYLVESTYHMWNSKFPYTILVCSKNEVKLTSDYRNVKLIMQRGK